MALGTSNEINTINNYEKWKFKTNKQNIKKYP